MTDLPTVLFLRDTQHGGPADQAAHVAAALAGFADVATTSLDIAIYDFRLDDADLVAMVVGALTRAADRGVAVRIAYDAGKPAEATAATFAALEADPAPPGTTQWVTTHFGGTAVATKAIAAGGQLMHSKYIVRDAGAAGSPAVWTGSTNFTDDAWTRQENNIVITPGADLAAAYRTDFDQMWASGAIKATGKGDTGTASAGAGTVTWDFCPGDGSAINAALAERIDRATTRIVIAAMVLTSHEVLTSLAAAVERGVPVSGIYDGGQMDPIVAMWGHNPHSAAVLADWKAVSSHLRRKNSTPYSPTSVHDFMHLKVLLADDTLTTGSYNFSANAQRNAENQLRLTDPDLVAVYDAFITTVVGAYPAG